MEFSTPYQIIVPLFCIVMISYAWNLVLRQKKTIWEGMLWGIFWLAIAYISVVPKSLQYVSTITGIRSNETAATVTSIGVLFFAVFYIVIRIEEVEQRMTRLIRDRALHDAGIEQKRNSQK